MSQVMSPISPLDVAWLLVDSDATPMHVGCVLVFELPDDAGPGYGARLYDELLGQKACVPPYSLRMHRQGLELPRWEALDEIDTEYHVQRWALPAPGDDAELNTLVARLHGEALDLSKPLWEFHLIEGLQGHRMALYTKLHHSITDGIGGIHLLRSMLSGQGEKRVVAPWSPDGPIAGLQIVDPPERQHKRQVWLQRLHKISEELRNLPGVSNTLGSLAWAALHRRNSNLQAPYTAPECMLNNRVSQQREFATARLSLDTMRAVAKHAGVSINDVLLGACAGALRGDLQARQALPTESLLAGLPVSVRPDGDTHVGTAVSFIIASLGTQLADRRERLGHIHASTRAAKANISSLSRAALTEYTLLMMAPYMTELLTGLAGHVTPAFNLIVSNVPGPSDTLYFNDARLCALQPLSIVTHGQALNITAVGYENHLDIGLTCCHKTLPGLTGLARGIESELHALERWSQGQG